MGIGTIRPLVKVPEGSDTTIYDQNLDSALATYTP